MSITACITEGFRLINRHWQLAAAQLIASVINLVGFLTIVGVPVAIAIVMVGLDISSAGDIEGLIARFQDPAELFSNYSGMLAVALIAVFIYAIFAFSIYIFAFGGCAGVMRRCILDAGAAFSTGDFFLEGRRLFMPLMGLTALAGLLLIGGTLVLSLAAGITAAAWGAIGVLEDGGMAGTFVTVLLVLTASAALLLLMFMVFALTAWGIAAMCLEGLGPARSIGRAMGYIQERPASLLLLVVTGAGYIAAQMVVALLGMLAKSIPLIGLVLTLPYQIVTYAIQGYLGMAILASMFIYYRGTAPAYASAAISGNSIAGGNTSS